jgi:hypothetical protein
MVRKLLLVFGLFFLASFPAQAQDTAEVFGGYSYMHFHTSLSGNVNGGEIAGQYKFTDWVGGVADLDGHYGSLGGISTSTYTFLFGPQVSLPSRVSPFGHLLLGGAHISGPGFGDTSFAMALGGGIDTRISHDRFYWRVIQMDYLITQFGGHSQNNFRLSTGIVVKF